MIPFRRDPVRGLSPAEAASYWTVRHDSGTMTPAEKAAFQRWLAASDDHGRAWARAGVLWTLFDDPDDRHLRAMRSAALAHRTRRAPRIAAIAGGIAACGTAALLLFGMPDRAVAPAPSRVAQAAFPAAAGTQHYRTARGERLSVTLADQTVLTLDTDTAVAVQFAPGRRSVRLARGQALFEVAKDPRRPFTVEAGGRRVTALGTVFDVSLSAATLKVMLVEGKVAVSHARSGRAGRSPILLRPGQGLTATAGAQGRVTPIDVEAALLWRDGMISLEDVSLADAVTELNRYSGRQLLVSDPAVAGLRVSGVFRTGAPEWFASSIAEVLPVVARPTRDGIELVRRPAAAPDLAIS